MTEIVYLNDLCDRLGVDTITVENLCGLVMEASAQGCCHLRTIFYKPELAGLIPPDTVENKAEMLVDYEDRLNIFDTIILCRF